VVPDAWTSHVFHAQLAASAAARACDAPAPRPRQVNQGKLHFLFLKSLPLCYRALLLYMNIILCTINFFFNKYCLKNDPVEVNFFQKKSSSLPYTYAGRYKSGPDITRKMIILGPGESGVSFDG
jgi:hypothetical protein